MQRPLSRIDAIADNVTNDMPLVVCRFFLKATDFDEEIGHYTDPVLQKVLPQLVFATNNADGAVRSRSGYRFPPMLILERGAPRLLL